MRRSFPPASKDNNDFAFTERMLHHDVEAILHRCPAGHHEGTYPFLVLFILSFHYYPFRLHFAVKHPATRAAVLSSARVVSFRLGFFCLFITFRAILKMFWTAINSHELTGEKIKRLMLTYFYMLFAFAGIYLVLYFDSEFNMVHQELSNISGSVPPLKSNAGTAFSGISLHFWPVVGLPIDWAALPFIYLDMLYFSATTMTTLGFGDIVAKLPFVKLLVIIEAFCGNLLLILGMASVVPHQNKDT